MFTDGRRTDGRTDDGRRVIRLSGELKIVRKIVDEVIARRPLQMYFPDIMDSTIHWGLKLSTATKWFIVTDITYRCAIFGLRCVGARRLPVTPFQCGRRAEVATSVRLSYGCDGSAASTKKGKHIFKNRKPVDISYGHCTTPTRAPFGGRAITVQQTICGGNVAQKNRTASARKPHGLRTISVESLWRLRNDSALNRTISVQSPRSLRSICPDQLFLELVQKSHDDRGNVNTWTP